MKGLISELLKRDAETSKQEKKDRKWVDYEQLVQMPEKLRADRIKAVISDKRAE